MARHRCAFIEGIAHSERLVAAEASYRLILGRLLLVAGRSNPIAIISLGFRRIHLVRKVHLHLFLSVVISLRTFLSVNVGAF